MHKTKFWIGGWDLEKDKLKDGDCVSVYLSKEQRREPCFQVEVVDDGPGPMIRIKNLDVYNALTATLEYVIEHEAKDFEDQLAQENEPQFSTDDYLNVLIWLKLWQKDRPCKVPIEILKKSQHVFAQAVVVRASWNKKEL